MVHHFMCEFFMLRSFASVIHFYLLHFYRVCILIKNYVLRLLDFIDRLWS